MHKTSWNFAVKIGFTILSGSVLYPLGAETVTPDVDGKWNVKCECLIAFSGCESELLSTAAGKPLQSWFQEVFVQKNVAVDLNAACYRKRDTDNGGQGLCCTFQSAGKETETIKNLFRGTKH